MKTETNLKLIEMLNKISAQASDVIYTVKKDGPLIWQIPAAIALGQIKKSK